MNDKNITRVAPQDMSHANTWLCRVRKIVSASGKLMPGIPPSRARAARAEQLGRIEECAHAYAQLGDSDRAFAWLERGVEEKDVGIASLATDPFLKPLRSDPRFADLTRRIGLLLSAP